MFGGNGYGNSGLYAQPLNDLWEFSPATGDWTWVSGSETAGAAGIYGQQGTPSTANVPGARQAAVSWVDAAGNIWVFGGQSYNATTETTSSLNDLWEFSPSAGTWTWVSGSVAGAAGANGPGGVYGTKGTPAAGNVPGARYSSSAWTDSSGNLWLFGGYGNDSTGAAGYLNDLWKFNPATSQWTWVAGSNLGGALGVYGTQGVAAATNLPGGRNSASSATDASGNFWMFGGGGLAATGTSSPLNDLWMFNPTTAEWTWVSGSSAGDAPGSLGTPGVPAPGNSPGARYGAPFWIAGGNAWMESGLQAVGDEGFLEFYNDLWVYTPAP
jgi:N-acetylneuraminic acid mutarotase